MRSITRKPKKSIKEYVEIDGKQRLLTTNCVRRVNLYNGDWLINYKRQLALGGRIIHNIETRGNYAYISCYFAGRITALNRYWQDKREGLNIKLEQELSTIIE